MRIKLIAMMLAGSLALPVSANAETAIVILQPNSPLALIGYRVRYQEESRESYSSNPDQIKHSISYRNVSEKTIVAVRIYFGAFDVFNDFMQGFGGIDISTIEPNQMENGTWNQRPYAAFSFKDYGTGFAYVKDVRFEDGTIWTASEENIVEQLRQIEADFAPEYLEEQRE